MISIEKVTDSKSLKQFIDYPHSLYKNDGNYVPELFIAQRDLLNSKKHPFFDHSKLDLFLAYKNNKVDGRIAAIRNNNHIDTTGKKDGFFGFFDVADDYEVAEKLLDTVSNWTKDEGLTSVLGPTNFSTNETCGMLVDGFESPPLVMMTYNKAYYPEFLQKYGFEKKMDLLAYHLTEDKLSEKAVRLASSIENRLKGKGIVVRTINMKKFDEDVAKIKSVYNAAWEKNWGFVPMTDKEFEYMAKDMKMILDPDFALIAEHNGKPVGFSLAIPDVNQILIDVKRGRLLPFGILKLLFFKNKINKLRVITLGVVKDYRKLGIEACFYSKTIVSGLKKNFVSAEASWILENNEMMNQAMVNMNGDPYKRYRIYEKTI